MPGPVPHLPHILPNITAIDRLDAASRIHHRPISGRARSSQYDRSRVVLTATLLCICQLNASDEYYTTLCLCFTTTNYNLIASFILVSCISSCPLVLVSSNVQKASSECRL